jgi:hypothetical protein
MTENARRTIHRQVKKNIQAFSSARMAWMFYSTYILVYQYSGVSPGYPK